MRKLNKGKRIETYFEDLPDGSTEFDLPSMEVPEHSLAMEDLYNRIENSVNQLPPQQQTAFRLKRYEGKKIKEVAEIMGLSVKTVEMHLSKALTTLREDLKDCLPAFLLFILLK